MLPSASAPKEHDEDEGEPSQRRHGLVRRSPSAQEAVNGRLTMLRSLLVADRLH